MNLTRKFWRYFYSSICFLAMGGFSSSLLAECDTGNCNDDSFEDLGTGFAISLGLTVGLTTSGGVTTTLLVQNNKKREKYLAAHNKALRKAFSLGYGKSLDDIFKFYGVPQQNQEKMHQSVLENRNQLIEKISFDVHKSEDAAKADQFLKEFFHKKM